MKKERYIKKKPTNFDEEWGWDHQNLLMNDLNSRSERRNLLPSLTLVLLASSIRCYHKS